MQSMENTAPIFLISDNHTWAVRSTKWRLERLLGNNINVILGHDGENAVQLFNEIVTRGDHSRIRAVLLGCHMPKLSGQDAAMEIRKIESMNNLSRPVAIIGTTTDLNEGIHAEFIQAGTNSVLQKPIPDGELELLVTAIIEQANN